MRVLIVAHNAVGESNRMRVESIAGLADVDVELLTPRWWIEEGGRIDVRPQPRGERFRWHVGRTLFTNNGTRHLYMERLFHVLRRFRPDVIDLYEEPFTFVAQQALLGRRAFAPRAALLFYSAVNVNRTWRRPYRWIERAMLASADGAYVPNADVPSILRAKGMRAPVEVVPLGVDAARFATATARDLSRDFGVETGPPYVGFLGRLEPVKGLGVLLHAASRLRTPATVVIAGDGPERDRLASLVRRDALDRRVRFLPGLPFQEVPSFIKALDLLVLPSVTIPPQHREQFGRVLVEAMAAGVPVIGSSSGAIPEVIGDAGIVVPEGDAAALAEAIDRVVGDPALGSELSRRGRARVAEYYAWPVIARRMQALYRAAVVRRRGAMMRDAATRGLEV